MNMALADYGTQPASRQPRIVPGAQSRWLQVVSHLDPKYGGMSAVVPELGHALAQEGRYSVEVAAFCAPGEEFRPKTLGDARLSHWPSRRGSWLHNPELRGRFHETVGRAEGLHLHGLWEQSTAVASAMARAAGKPYVLSAHGMLEPWALRKKWLKKLLYAAFVERANVKGAACLHALTRAEADDYLRFGAPGPIAVLHNGVHIPADRGSADFLAQFPHLAGRRIILFLGRLHRKKGVDLLVDAWAKVAPRWPEAQLVFAGPDAEGTQRALEQLVLQHGLKQQVTFTGMLRERMKWSALAASEGFVLPSHSEGLSVSVLEAMGMGLPVIVTEQCNMPDVKQHDAGWEIQPKVDELAAALGELLRNSASINAAIGLRGSFLVEERYNWTSIAERMADVYRWVQGGPLPHSVDLVYR